ncbi:3-dehydroquinate synthase [Bdellovibrionota bacterium FG-2]
MELQTLRIKSGQGDYEVEFKKELAQVIAEALKTPKAVCVIDRKVAGLYQELLKPLTSELPTFFVDATEEEKSMVGLTKVLSWLGEQGCMKQNQVIAVGGGITQDIVSLSAHLYYRGLKWVFVPTTLLSMSDSCIGAKCGVNLNAFKNQVGCFHAPSRVLICPEFTRTLSDGDLSSGYGEILKLMVTGSRAKFERFAQVLDAQGMRNSNILEFIYESLKIKQAVIEVDEYEKDLRRILNYGHTFGHALESYSQYEIPHGQAVAWGMDLVNFIAMKKGRLSAQNYQAIQELIKKHFRFSISKKIDAKAIIAGSKKDKKVADGQVNLILLKDFGTLEIVKTPFDASLEALIEEYVALGG